MSWPWRFRSGPQPTIERAVADVVAASLPADDAGWSLQWRPMGVRLGNSRVLWHLSVPEDDYDTLGGGAYRRRGLLSVGERVGNFAVCGDAREVHAMALSMQDFRLDRGNVIAALGQIGVSVTEVSRRDPVVPQDTDPYDRSLRAGVPEQIVWSLRKPGHGEATLTADHVCTPFGIRSAPMCWTRFTVRFRSADPVPMDCPLPGRFGV